MEDSDDFTYFLPRGIEDDQDDFSTGGQGVVVGGFDEDDSGSSSVVRDRENSVSSDGSGSNSVPSYSNPPSYHSRSTPHWQSTVTQPVHTSAAQQAAIMAMQQSQ